MWHTVSWRLQIGEEIDAVVRPVGRDRRSGRGRDGGAVAHVAADGGALYQAKLCHTCHGPDGNSPTPLYPNLAGQYETYLLQALKDYKTGARKNAIMAGMVAALSEEDLADLAAYYASHRIRFNLLAPGLIDTPMAQRALQNEAIMKYVQYSLSAKAMSPASNRSNNSRKRASSPVSLP